MTRTIVQLVLVNDTGDSYYRMRWPGALIATQNPSWRVINLDAQAEERFLWAEHADLLVIFQSNDIDLIPIIEARRARGLRTLVEYNDNFYDSQAWSPVAKPWRSPLVWQTYETLMNSGDRLLVTGPGLKELFSKRTSVPIEILRNDVPFDVPEFSKLQEKPTDEISIGWAGSLGHMADVLWIAPVLRRLVQDFSNVRIHIMGNETLPSLLRIPPERLRYVPWGTMNQYFQFWGPVRIGLAPLLDSGYNRCRSDIKAVEMTATGTLPVLSRALPYEDFIQRTAAPHFSSASELEETLRRFIEEPEKIKPRLEPCFDYVRSERVGPREFTRSLLYAAMMQGIPESTFRWPLAVGYHELKGTTEKAPRSHTVLLRVQDLWNKGSREKATLLAADAVRINPLNAEWALAHLKCCLRLNPNDIDGMLEEYQKRFPRDLRFILAAIQRTKEDGKRSQLWDEVLEALSRMTDVSREFFRPEIIRVLNGELINPPRAAELAEKLLALYPQSPECQLVRGDALERMGEFQSALAIFEALASLAAVQEQGKDFFGAVELGYLESMKEMLRGRISAPE